MRVAFWDWDESGKEVRLEGEVEDRFIDPEERYGRPSVAVRLDNGRVMTPYEDECIEVG